MKIALLGYDTENAGAYRYLKARYPEALFTIYDQSPEPVRELPENVEFVGGLDNFKDIEADISVRTPGVALSKVQVSGQLTTATKLFFDECTAQVVGVTGTKGKGTTCTLIAKILEAAGKKVHLVGNIGKPALDILEDIQDDDVVVYELSSFQLWDLEKSPHIAVVLMIEADHLNVHESLDEYIEAKANIAIHQSAEDCIIYHPTNPNSAGIAGKSPAQKQRFGTTEGAHIEDGSIVIFDQKICSVDQVGLIGAHNLENICAAITASWHYTQNVEAIASAVRDFKGLPHHIEKVKEIDGVEFYDDSFSSAPAATIAAIKSFDKPEVVIVGGAHKGADFGELVSVITHQDNIKKIVLIGESATQIAKLLEAANETRFEVNDSGDFAKIVQRTKELSESGDVVLLSPGCASFDMFKNFYERGDRFQEIVKSL